MGDYTRTAAPNIMMTNVDTPIELIGMMDSPFVRRVAIALTHYEIPFQIQPLSVYLDVEHLATTNPMLTVPVLRAGGMSFVDSREILAWLDTQVPHAHLQDRHPLDHHLQRAASDVLALKAGELYREIALRDQALHSVPSILRLVKQISAALRLLEDSALCLPEHLNHSCIAIATSYRFARMVAAYCNQTVPTTPVLHEYCLQWEQSAAFLACDPS